MAVADFGEEGGEGYFASVSDLMVGILFVFLLMLTVFAVNFQDDQTASRKELEAAQAALEQATRQARDARFEAEREKERATQAIAEAQRKSEENTRLRGLLEQAVARLERDLEERQASRNRLLASLERSLQERGIRVTLDQRSGILRLAGDLLFRRNASGLEGDAPRTVSALAEVLTQVLPCYTQAENRAACPAEATPILEAVLVEGHTDRQGYPSMTPAASRSQNDRLSTDRALTVFKALHLAQPALDGLRNGEELPLVAFSGYGERRPLPDALGATPKDFEQNRRIDLRFVLSSRTSDELQRLREQIRGALKGPS